jgi:hypothetical protein
MLPALSQAERSEANIALRAAIGFPEYQDPLPSPPARSANGAIAMRAFDAVVIAFGGLGFLLAAGKLLPLEVEEYGAELDAVAFDAPVRPLQTDECDPLFFESGFCFDPMGVVAAGAVHHGGRRL